MLHWPSCSRRFPISGTAPSAPPAPPATPPTSPPTPLIAPAAAFAAPLIAPAAAPAAPVAAPAAALTAPVAAVVAAFAIPLPAPTMESTQSGILKAFSWALYVKLDAPNPQLRHGVNASASQPQLLDRNS